MNSFKKGIKSLKVPLLIISMIIIFSFGFTAVNAADTSHINESSSDYNITTGQIVTDTFSTTTDQSNSSTSTLALTKSEDNIQPISKNNFSNSLNSDNKTFPDPQIYRGGVFIGSFTRIADAIAAAQSGDTISLEEGKTFYENNFYISKNLNFNVLNGGTAIIDGSGNRIFYIKPGYTVTFKNIIFQNGKSSYGGAILNYGALFVTGCSFIGNTATGGGAIFNSGGYLSVIGSSFTDTATKNGGAIYNALGGTLIINGGCWFGNNRASYGGAVYGINAGSLSITDSTFTGNHAINGAGVYYDNGGSLTVTGSTFTSNTASWDGGAIYNAVGGLFTVDTSIFTSNNAFGGGAIHNSGTLTVTNSNFTGNCASNDGGAIENVYGGGIYNFKINNSYFLSNSAINGGAVFNNEGEPLNVQGSTFTGNHATKYGGGIVNKHSGKIINCNFSKNSASKCAGAIFNNGGTMSVSSSIFKSNTASAYGGALYNNVGTMSIIGNTFTSNHATLGGGAVINNCGKFSVINNNFTKNSAKYGGAIYNRKSRYTYILLNKCIGNSATKGINYYKS